MKIAITGASGLIGQKIVEFLLAENHQLTCLSRSKSTEIRNGVDWIVGDLTSDGVAGQILDQHNTVIHLAHESTPLSIQSSSITSLEKAISPTIKLIDAATASKNVPHIIYLSSGGAVYGEPIIPKRPIQEVDRCEPLTEYGIQKLVIERHLHRAAMGGIIRATILRVANAYGELLSPCRMQGLIGTSVARVLQGQPLRLIGNPQNVRDYVHLNDISFAIKLTLNNTEIYDVFNIGSGIGYSVVEILEMINIIGSCDSPVEIQDSPGSNLLPNWNVLDISKAKQKMGWYPQISLKTGVQRMFQLG